MNITQVKKLYDQYAKYEKTDWIINKSIDILGHKVSLDCFVEISLGNWSSVDVCIETIETPKDKVSVKFFKDLQRITGVDIDDLYIITDSLDDAQRKVEKEFQWVFDIRLKPDAVSYIHQLFYEGTVDLVPWANIKAVYSQDRMDSKASKSIKLNKNYDAVLTKGADVQVGCQSIPIDKIREIITEYDKL